jgi:DNA-binding GntR family transcriptional regulator
VPGASALIANRILEDTTRYIERAGGRAVRYSQERVSARLATPEEGAELRLPTPLAVLETRRTAWDEHDRPVTYEVGLAQPGYEITFTYTAEES